MEEIRELSFSNSGTRVEIREKLISEFLKEDPGTGTKDLASKYIYYVENLKNGNRIYLKRPAHLNKGFDFLINVENEIFLTPKNRKQKNPAHYHIFEDLQQKKTENKEKYKLLYDSIEAIYNCHEITDEMISISFKTGYSAEMLLKTIKWFFIEQDVTYWNYSGRKKFMSGIPEP